MSTTGGCSTTAFTTAIAVVSPGVAGGSGTDVLHDEHVAHGVAEVGDEGREKRHPAANQNVEGVREKSGGRRGEGTRDRGRGRERPFQTLSVRFAHIVRCTGSGVHPSATRQNGAWHLPFQLFQLLISMLRTKVELPAKIGPSLRVAHYDARVEAILIPLQIQCVIMNGCYVDIAQTGQLVIQSCNVRASLTR